MIGMRRRGRAVAVALLAALSLVETRPARCSCPPAPVASEHECCAPVSSVRPANPGCCTAVATTRETTATAPEGSVALVPGLVVVAWVMPAAPPVLERGPASPSLLASPPLTVRRL